MTTASWDALRQPRRAHDELRAPSRWLWAAEYRSLWELGLSLATAPVLLGAPRGDGHPVLVLPGFLASDVSTQVLRAYLKRLGYDAYAWKLGRNLGGIVRMRSGIRERLESIRERTGKRVTVIGWSLGGIYARDLALSRPEAVRSVVTLGSPFSRDPNASNVSTLYEYMTGEGPTPDEKAARLLFPHEFDRLRRPLAMPSTSIFTKLDGVVNWRACLLNEDERTENIEVLGASHVGLGVNPAVLWAVADRLALAEGTFAPFDRGGPFALGYGRQQG